MRNTHYLTCKVCNLTKPKVKEFASRANRSIYSDVCKACYVPSRMTGPRVKPVVIERPGVKTRWVKEYYEPMGVGI